MALELWAGEKAKIKVKVKNTGAVSRSFKVECDVITEAREMALETQYTPTLRPGETATVSWEWQSERGDGWVDLKARVRDRLTGRTLDTERKDDAIFVKYVDAEIVECTYATLKHLCNWDSYAYAEIKNTGNVRQTFYVYFLGKDPASYDYNHAVERSITLNPGEKGRVDFLVWECIVCQQSHCYDMLGDWEIKIVVSTAKSWEYGVVASYEGSPCTVIE